MSIAARNSASRGVVVALAVGNVGQVYKYEREPGGALSPIASRHLLVQLAGPAVIARRGAWHWPGCAARTGRSLVAQLLVEGEALLVIADRRRVIALCRGQDAGAGQCVRAQWRDLLGDMASTRSSHCRPSTR